MMSFFDIKKYWKFTQHPLISNDLKNMWVFFIVLHIFYYIIALDKIKSSRFWFVFGTNLDFFDTFWKLNYFINVSRKNATPSSSLLLVI